MSNIKGCFLHNSDEWSTPLDLFSALNDEFHFTLDPCSTFDNHLCSKFYTIYDDGLLLDWSNEVVFCNPPYSKIKDWVKKCYLEWKINKVTIVLLIPVRTDTIYFHEYIYPYCELRFIKGRLKFGDSNNSAPFPSMLCIFN